LRLLIGIVAKKLILSMTLVVRREEKVKKVMANETVGAEVSKT
jgi:hypothetical protein